eukprot:403366540
MSTFSLIFFNIPPILLSSTIARYADKESEVFFPLLSVMIFFWILTNINFAMTAYSNPGILPRLSLQMRTLANIEESRKKGAMALVVGQGGRYVTRIKYCHTCYIYRPERTFHCNFCGNCVHRFDHHCKWLGTCIGGLNYRTFLFFLISLSLLQWVCIAYSITHFMLLVQTLLTHEDVDESFQIASKRFPASIIAVAICLVIASFVTHLFLYHLKIICKSYSTYEEKKKIFKKSLFNPYNQSFCSNLRGIFCQRKQNKFYTFDGFEADKLSESLRKLSYQNVRAGGRVIQKYTRRITRQFSTKSNSPVKQNIESFSKNDAMKLDLIQIKESEFRSPSYVQRINETEDYSNTNSVINMNSGGLRMTENQARYQSDALSSSSMVFLNRNEFENNDDHNNNEAFIRNKKPSIVQEYNSSDEEDQNIGSLNIQDQQVLIHKQSKIESQDNQDLKSASLWYDSKNNSTNHREDKEQEMDINLINNQILQNQERNTLSK